MGKKIFRKMTDAERAVAEKKTESRKERNRERNERKHQANLDYIKEHGLSTFPIERTIQIKRKAKKDQAAEVIERKVIRNAAPNTIVARHRNSLDNTRHLAWLEAQKGSPLPPSSSTAQHLRAKERAAREKALQIVVPQEA